MLNLCGAQAKSTGNPCQQPAMANGRCRLHGGKSTGPRTKDGLLRCKMAKWKHGHRSKEAIEERRQLSYLLRQCDELLD